MNEDVPRVLDASNGNPFLRAVTRVIATVFLILFILPTVVAEYINKTATDPFTGNVFDRGIVYPAMGMAFVFGAALMLLSLVCIRIDKRAAEIGFFALMASLLFWFLIAPAFFASPR